jgi:phosphohistidine phosphatase SixA
MKRIVLIRHGKAVMGGKDHERELDEDGIIQAQSLKESY